MAVSYVQSAKYTGTASQTNMTFTLGTTPVVGNLLLMGVMYATADDPFLTPAGWVRESNVESGQSGIGILSRVVQAGDTTSWNVTPLSVADQNSGALYEVSGQAAAGAVHKLGNTTNTSSATSNASPTLRATVAGCLGLAFCVTVGTTLSGTAISPEWTLDQTIASTFQPALAMHLTAPLTDIGVTASNTVSGLPSAQNSQTILLVRPAINTPENIGRYTTVGDGMGRAEVAN